MRQRSFIKVLLVVIVLAIIDSAYLIALHYATTSTLCGLLGSSCDVVNKSVYAEMFGIPVAVYGFVTFLLLLGLAIVVYRNKTVVSLDISPQYAAGSMVILLSIGVAFGLFLMYIQKFVLQRWCLFCLSLDILMWIALFVSVRIYKGMKKE